MEETIAAPSEAALALADSAAGPPDATPAAGPGEATWHDGRLWTWTADADTTLAVAEPGSDATRQQPAVAVRGRDLLQALHDARNGEHDSVRAFGKLFAFAEAAVAREQFYPSARRDPAGVIGSWRLLVGDGRDVERLERFAAAMPGVCFCADEGAGRVADRLELVEQLLDACCDGLVREALAKDEFFGNVHERAENPDAEAEVRWISTLVRDSDEIAANAQLRFVEGRDREVATLLDKVQTWTARLGDDGGEPWRLGFELMEPDSHEAELFRREDKALSETPDELPTEPDDDRWPLTWSLLPPPEMADQHAPLPARQVWDQPAGSIGYVGRNAVRLRERLAAELRRAADYLPPLARVLQHDGAQASAATDPTRSSHLWLSGDEAFRLMRDWAEVLSDGGFDARLPGWANSRESRVEVVMNLSPTDDSLGGGEFGRATSARAGLEALLKFDWRIAVGGDEITGEEFRALVRAGQPLIRRGGKWIEVDPEAAAAAAELMDRRPAGELTLGEAFRAGFGLGEFRTSAGTAPAVRLAGLEWVDELLEQVPGKAEALPQPAAFKGELRPYQLRGLQWLAFLDRLGLGGVLADDMGLGKAQPLDAKILTPTGWTTMGEVKAGQQVIGSDGRPTKVTGVFPQGELEVFRVTFSDGASVECCDDHLWAVSNVDRFEAGEPFEPITLRKLRERLVRSDGSREPFIIPTVSPVVFDNDVDGVPAQPCARREELMKLMAGVATAGSSTSWHIDRAHRPTREVEAQIRFMAMSLGGLVCELARVNERSWAQVPTELDGVDLDGPRHLHVEIPTQDRVQPYRYIWSVEPAERKPCQCISVDAADQLYVTNEFVVTHNTVQMIALLLHERAMLEKEGLLDAEKRPTLLFVPTSVLGNWGRELERFAPMLSVLHHHGPGRLRGDTFVSEARNSDVVVTSYALSHRDKDDLRKVKWGRVVLDEAQKVKNPNAASSQAVRGLDVPRRVALTGTPVENHLGELWSIMDLLNPGLLGTQGEFRERFAIPIEKHNDRGRARRLREMIRPFIMRRTKDEPEVAADLPEKMEMAVYCGLTPEQAAAYENITGDMLGRIDTASGIRRRGLILSVLTKLKQVCNHPALLAGDPASDFGGPVPKQVARSGKATRLCEMMEEVIEEGEKALIFTQYRKMGDLLVQMLEHRLNRRIAFLHGGTPQPKREEMILDFQNTRHGGGADVFILSLRAGGLGLNLTAATHVFHYDRWWNPAVENQATDRAYRIGQTKRVQVHKFVTLGTVEERIDKMLAEKTALAQNIVGSGDEWLTELSTGELKEYLSLSRQHFGPTAGGGGGRNGQSAADAAAADFGQDFDDDDDDYPESEAA